MIETGLLCAGDFAGFAAAAQPIMAWYWLATATREGDDDD